MVTKVMHICLEITLKPEKIVHVEQISKCGKNDYNNYKKQYTHGHPNQDFHSTMSMFLSKIYAIISKLGQMWYP